LPSSTTPSPANLSSSQISPTPLVPPADCPKVISNTSRPDTPPDNVEFEKELQEFYASLMAATTGLTSSPKKRDEYMKLSEKARNKMRKLERKKMLKNWRIPYK
uniref:Uncharacterized protein n=1 Tax=Meloidogyne floridensis TaxID=298350 RepID=A0A915P541_9BILA